jgi:hypothetical protein
MLKLISSYFYYQSDLLNILTDLTDKKRTYSSA